MTRYLTPHRIGILVLVQEYFLGQLPLTSRMRVLGFIAKHSNIKDVEDGPSGQDLLSRIDANIIDLFLPLTTLASAVPGRSVYDILLRALWSLQSLHALHEFFEKVTQHVDSVEKPETAAKASIIPSRASPLGQYRRRCWLEFTRLEFDDTRSLWLAYTDWRALTFDQWSQRNPGSAAQYGVSDDVKDSDLTQRLIRPTSESVVSAADVNSVIASSIYYLQKLGTRAPEAMKGRLRAWLTDQHDARVQSLQHFMEFFDNWKAGQYTMALESLHRYFDYSLVAKSGSNDNMRVYYQYALLHLSVLHADFDCWEESVDAMDECIATARENHDTVCLNFALSWLLYLRQAKPKNGSLDYRSASGFLGAAACEQDEIGFLKAKARDTKHWSLLSSTLLEEAKLGMHLGSYDQYCTFVPWLMENRAVSPQFPSNT
ncbi:APC5 protein [Recurvomyces mirabilis]|nr:APC5 protein [Recurvomyces mirabilis]